MTGDPAPRPRSSAGWHEVRRSGSGTPAHVGSGTGHGSGMPTKKSPGPSVKDDHLYEKLRDEGNTKEKSARIANAAANTSRTTVGKKGGASPSYDDWTVADLRKRAAELDIEGRSSMRKSDLVDALRHH